MGLLVYYRLNFAATCYKAVLVRNLEESYYYRNLLIPNTGVPGVLD